MSIPQLLVRRRAGQGQVPAMDLVSFFGAGNVQRRVGCIRLMCHKPYSGLIKGGYFNRLMR